MRSVSLAGAVALTVAGSLIAGAGTAVAAADPSTADQVVADFYGTDSSAADTGLSTDLANLYAQVPASIDMEATLLLNGTNVTEAASCVDCGSLFGGAVFDSAETTGENASLDAVVGDTALGAGAGIGVTALALPIATVAAVGVEGLALKWEWTHFAGADGDDPSFNAVSYATDPTRFADSFPISYPDELAAGTNGRTLALVTVNPDPCGAGSFCDLGPGSPYTVQCAASNLNLTYDGSDGAYESDNLAHFGDGTTEVQSAADHYGTAYTSPTAAFAALRTDTMSTGNYTETERLIFSAQTLQTTVANFSGCRGLAIGGSTFPGTHYSMDPSIVANRWLTQREVCEYVPTSGGTPFFDAVASRSHEFAGGASTVPQIIFPNCPSEAGATPGVRVRRTVTEMPANKPLYDWTASPRYLDANDPAFGCLTGLTQGCTVHQLNPNAAPDSTTNPCEYGTETVPQSDCLAVSPTTWQQVRTKVRIAAEPTTAPTDPAVQPSASASAGTGTSTDPEPGGAAASSSDGCFPSGWGVFNPVEWVEKPVGCALTAAFVPSETEIQTDTTNLQSAFNASTLGQGATAVGNIFAGFSSVPAGGCEGPGFDVSRVDEEFADAHATYAPLETCDGLGQKVSDFARPWFVAGIWMAVAFTVYYIISKSIGAPD